MKIKEINKVLDTDYKSVKEFKNNIDWNNWDYISINKNLSEDFIREFQDKVNWININFLIDFDIYL